MSTLKKLSIVTAGAVIVATGLAADTAQAITFTSTPHTSTCDPNGCVTSVSGATAINFNGTIPSTGPVTYGPATYSYPNGTTFIR